MTIPAFIRHLLYRLGHLFGENPISLLKFGWRFILTFKYLLTDLAESPTAAFKLIWYNLRMATQAFLQGLLVVAALGALLGYIVNQTAANIGGVLQFVFDSVVLRSVFKDILPLIIAIVVAGKAGASIASRFASYPFVQKRHDYQTQPVFTFSDEEVYREVVPQLTATVITSIVFYLIILACVVMGYVSSDVRGFHLGESLKEGWHFIQTGLYGATIEGGMLRAAIFGFIIAFIAAALGIQASEEFTSRREEPYELHNAVWESASISISLCILITYFVI